MDDRELAVRLPDVPATAGPHAVVVVAPGPVGAVLDHLLLHFNDHPDDELEVRREGVTLGYVTADTLYRILPPRTRGTGGGDADHFALLGEPGGEVLVLDCPEGDYSLSVVLYPAGSPPHCPHHPDLVLQVRQ
jgi:hypothetical protein